MSNQATSGRKLKTTAKRHGRANDRATTVRGSFAVERRRRTEPDVRSAPSGTTDGLGIAGGRPKNNRMSGRCRSTRQSSRCRGRRQPWQTIRQFWVFRRAFQ